ncbi:MAG: YggS family pyridoxal phosphate-dependent enzyme [Halothiobacillaceae bacterium]|jgi:pyridoxal phosphate enzyme (YggS family)|nr:YggS family pyridoxal phosphate-dependent enzyme [Halothiobacillaceae bacterium]MDY0049649.1 YggS family pyridoxal phosphate-dependent enzyme [Halothiobacillaceae bacterium]
MNDLQHRYDDLLARMARAAQQVGRKPAEVRLIAVSKTFPPAMLRTLAELGQRDFGESYVQEALPKQHALADLELCWHFIGPLQSNKTRPVAEHFDWVHGVDRLRIAERLSSQRPDSRGALNVCLQVNIDDEASKSGVAPADLPALAEQVASLPRLRLRGLMTLPRPRGPGEDPHEPFRALRALADTLRAHGHTLDTLSMGMSEDFEAAIHEGATHVRVGSALFGRR